MWIQTKSTTTTTTTHECLIDNVINPGGYIISRVSSLTAVNFHPSSVQLSSRWYLCAQKSPYTLHPVSRKFPLRYLSNSSHVCMIGNVHLNGIAGDNLVIQFGGKEQHEGHVPVLFLKQYDHSATSLSMKKAAVEVNTYATVSVKGAGCNMWFPCLLCSSLVR